MNISSRLLDSGNYSPRSESNYYNASIETQYLENKKKMAEQVRGTIQYVPKPRDFTKGNKVTKYYSIKVNDVYYSVGSTQPPEAGTLVEFEAEQKGEYWNVTKAGIRVVPAGNPTSNISGAAVSSASKSVMSKDDYWGNKEKRDMEWQHYQRTVVQPKIELQAARNAAIEFVKLLIVEVPYENSKGEIQRLPSLKLGANIAKREEILAAAVEKYTKEFVEQNASNSENNNKNEQLPQAETSSQKDSESVDSDDSAWAV